MLDLAIGIAFTWQWGLRGLWWFIGLSVVATALNKLMEEE